jgi:hypothetical protein
MYRRLVFSLIAITFAIVMALFFFNTNTKEKGQPTSEIPVLKKEANPKVYPKSPLTLKLHRYKGKLKTINVTAAGRTLSFFIYNRRR